MEGDIRSVSKMDEIGKIKEARGEEEDGESEGVGT